MQELRVAQGAVERAVEDVREGFALHIMLDVEVRRTAGRGAGEGGLTTRFLDFAIISLAKFFP